MVRSSEDDRGFFERNDDGDSRFHKHGDDEGHRSHESKSSKHKHKHHKHKNRRKHKKEASTEEVASDVGDCGVRDRGQNASQVENMPKADAELANSQVKDVFESSEKIIDTAVTQNEQVEMNAGMFETGEIKQILERTFSGSDNLHKVDDEMEEGEILDEDTEVCQAQVEVLPMDFLPADGLEQSHDSLKVGYNVPLECISVKLSANANLEPRSDDSLGESRSINMFMGRDETVNQFSPGGKDSGSNQASHALVSPENIAISMPSRLSSERVIERGGRSRSMSRDSRHLRDSLIQYDDERDSMSRDIAHKNKYAGSSHDRTDRVQQSRSKEVDARTWHEDINSRSRDHRRLEYADRRMSPSRSGRDYLDRRRSRSRGGYGDYMDQRRRSRSIERSRDRDRRRSLSRSGRDSANRRRSRSRGGYWDRMDKQRRSRSKESSYDQKAKDSMSYRGNKLLRGGGFNKVSEGQHKQKSEEKNLKEMDKPVREKETEDERSSALSQSEGEGVDKEVEKIRLRRQAIVDKHKKQEQLENMKNMDLNVGLDVNELTGSGNATILLDEHASEFILDKGSLQNGIEGRPLGLKSLGQGTPKSEEKPNNMVSDYIFGESPAGGRKQVKGDGMALETSGLTDNWDDAEGYYCHRIGEVLDGRYEIAASHGRGVFSSVVRARDLKAMRKDLEEIAIKIIRNNDAEIWTARAEYSQEA